MATDPPFRPQNAGPLPVDDPPLGNAVARGHETRDVHVPMLFTIAGSLLVGLVLVSLGMTWIFQSFENRDRHLDARAAVTEPGARSLVHLAPAYDGPLLQVKPEEDLLWQRKQDALVLDSYGWIDPKAGVVRIPIARAMDLVVAHGLPPVSPGLTLEAVQRQRADPQVWGQALRP